MESRQPFGTRRSTYNSKDPKSTGISAQTAAIPDIRTLCEPRLCFLKTNLFPCPAELNPTPMNRTAARRAAT